MTCMSLVRLARASSSRRPSSDSSTAPRPRLSADDGLSGSLDAESAPSGTWLVLCSCELAMRVHSKLGSRQSGGVVSSSSRASVSSIVRSSSPRADRSAYRASSFGTRTIRYESGLVAAFSSVAPPPIALSGAPPTRLPGVVFAPALDGVELEAR